MYVLCMLMNEMNVTHSINIGEGLSEEERLVIVDHVIKEVDLNEDERLSYPEFEHVIARAPDFSSTFKMTI